MRSSTDVSRIACIVSVLVVAAVNATLVRADDALDALSAWLERNRRFDSVHVTGTLTQYRVPAGADWLDASLWQSRPESGVAWRFDLLLRRPDFRLRLQEVDEHGAIVEDQLVAWVDGVHTRFSPRHMTGTLDDQAASPLMCLVPVLTPMEYRLFDWPVNDYAGTLARSLRSFVDDTLYFVLQDASEGSLWMASIELDRDRGSATRRIAMVIGEHADRQVLWDMQTTQFARVGDVYAPAEAVIMLYNSVVLREERVIFHYQATVTQKPITRADLMFTYPDQVNVFDRRTHESWVTGRPDSHRQHDPEEIERLRQTFMAQLATPEVLRKRGHAMWIIAGGAAAATGALGLGVLWRSRCAASRAA
ncbi:MAG: hypothetical protein IPM18_14910 [Phycisphaerales bacterium]|nr:hypothetical protein [Phycisphaerales bacterium]